ncbi:MAG: tetratricopeptide repeat protein [Enterovibrio sp.]
MEEFAGITEEYLKMVENIPLLNGKTIKEHSGISDSDLNNLHAIACAFFEKGKLNEAEIYFRHICLIDSANLDYMLGLGAVLQRKKLYGLAVDVYAAAHLIQKNDSRPMFYAGQCNFFERKYSKAKFCFNLVIEQNYSPELVKMAKLFIDAIDQGGKND